MTTTRSTSSPPAPASAADVHAVADLAVAGRCDLQLGDERGAELGPGDGRPDRVEVAEAVEHQLGALPRRRARRPRAGRARADRTTSRAARATTPPSPTTTGRRPGRRAPTAARRRTSVERLRRIDRRRRCASAASAMALGKAGLPVGLADDAGPPPDALPPRRSARGRPSASRAGTSPSSVIRAVRRRPRRSSSSRSASSRGTIRSSAPVPGRPFHGMPAAVSWCSTMRAYGRRVGHSTAMRSNRVPRRAPSTTARTARRTSSSASVVDTTSTGPDGGRHGLPRRRVRSGRRRAGGPTRRRPPSPVIPTISSTGRRRRWPRGAGAPTAAAAPAGSTTTRAMPLRQRASWPGPPRRVSRSPSSYQAMARRRATSAATRAGSLPRAVRASAVSAVGPATRSSR